MFCCLILQLVRSVNGDRIGWAWYGAVAILSVLMAPDKEEVIDGMGGIINRVAAYRNYDGALGFTFRFYSNEMVGNDQIRLLALNGVAPTKETIRDGSYPISSYFYAVTAAPIGQPAPEETNPTLKAFLDFCRSEQGQWIVEEAGYVGLN